MTETKKVESGYSWMLSNVMNGVEAEALYPDMQFAVGKSDKPADWQISNQNGRVGMAEWCPGNGTKYMLLFQAVFGKELAQKLGCGSSSILVTWWCPDSTSRTYPFSTHGYYAQGYVHEKLGGTAEDAWRVSQVIAEVLSGTADEFGPNGPGVA